MGKRKGDGHRPFGVLREMMNDGRLGLHPETEKPVAPPKRVRADGSDDETFRAAMSDGAVSELGWSEGPVELPPPFEIPSWSDGESEALTKLQEFVAGRGEMDPFAMGEGIEGASSDEARRLLPRLKQGAFSVQAELDLHGLGLEDAREELLGFLSESRARGLSCVRIVHGRGKHSPTEPHVLKAAVTRWLGSRKLRATVAAFASARWQDGGSGAVYVLLYGRWRPARR